MTGFKINKWDLIVLAVSFMLAIYYRTVIIPFADRHAFFNENFFPQRAKIFAYFIMIVPIYTFYFIFIFFSFKKIIFLRSINYPMIGLNLFFGLFLCLLTFGAGILWFAVILLPVALIVLMGALARGIRDDIKYIKYNK